MTAITTPEKQSIRRTSVPMKLAVAGRSRRPLDGLRPVASAMAAFLAATGLGRAGLEATGAGT